MCSILCGEGGSAVGLELQELLVLGPEGVINLGLAGNDLGLDRLEGTICYGLAHVLLDEFQLADNVFSPGLSLGVDDLILVVPGRGGELSIGLRPGILEAVDMVVLIVLPF